VGRLQVMDYYFLVFLNIEKEKKRFFLNRKNKIKINLLKLLLFKNKELMLETTIFFIYKYRLNIFLCNILNYININNFLNYFDTSLHLIRKPFLRKRLLVRKKIVNKKRYNLMLYLFFFFKNTELIAKFFAYSLLKTKKHIKSVKISLRLFYSLFIKQLLSLKGFKIYISGKLNGNMRKRKYAFKIGDMWLNTLDINVRHFFFPLFTKFGVFFY